MANPGSKFVSVNLNKSYGQQHSHSHHQSFHGGAGGSYGQAAASGRGRFGSGTGGGMVVLSRNRGSAPKVVPKLSVPPPLNLPSLRKEHEKFDLSGPGGGGAGAGTGSGARPNSSGVGWTKPVAAAISLPEKNDGGIDTTGVNGMGATDGASRGIGAYMPPSARSNGAGAVGSVSAARDFPTSADKAVVLRGEDFPSLQAARPLSSGMSQKQKDNLYQKKQVVGEDLTQDNRDSYHLGPLVDMHPLGQSSHSSGGNRFGQNKGEGQGMGSGRMADHIRKQEKTFPDPLPLVHVNPRSDWADDERDTGRGFVERGRDIGYSNSESYWDRDFDLPKPSVWPHKPAQNKYDKWGQRDNEAGKTFSSEVLKIELDNKDVRVPSQEGKEINRWRSSAFSKDGFSSQEVGNSRSDVGTGMAGQNNLVKESKYAPSHYGDRGRDGSGMHNQDSTFGRKNLGLEGRQQQWNNSIRSSNNRGAEHSSWNRHVVQQPNRYAFDSFQHNTLSKSTLASSGKMAPIADPILTKGWDKRFSKGDRPFSEDPFSKDFGSGSFDDRDLFSEGLVGAIKRKKDAAKSTEFHDPVRESFEAELERVQKMQELERQRIIEEQERALEQARREEEERQKRIREEEERRRILEEEAREAAWREEHERLEAIRRAEELRIAREEEKKRIQLEEERRKQAAKQKLQELEARMAMRQAEAAKGNASGSNEIVNEKLEAVEKEKDLLRNVELDTWEESERMVENVMTSVSFDSSAYSRPVELGSGPHPLREDSSNLLDRGKSVSSWRRGMFDNGTSVPSLSDKETGRYSPKRDVGGGRAFPRKESIGGSGYTFSKSYLKTGFQEPVADEFGYQKDQRWSLSVDDDSYGKLKEMDSELHDSLADKYGGSGWGQGRLRGNTHPPYPEPFYPHSESNELYSYGRSRYSMRQPRVLPPPSLASSQRTNSRVTEHSGPLPFLDNDIKYAHAANSDSTGQPAYYDNNQDGLEQSQIIGLRLENSTSGDQRLNNPSRCDSQSSLSVTSPPTSPPHLSHDELDESGDSPVTSAVEGKRSLLTESRYLAHKGNPGNGTTAIAQDSVSAGEDEEWSLENDGTLQQQEEYDEDEDAYREEDEVREGVDENIQLRHKFEELELEERELSHTMDNVVLGFDEGVEVVIPSDDFVKTPGTHERSFGIRDVSVGFMEERGPMDGFPTNKQSFLPAEDSGGTNADSTSSTVPETMSMQATIDHPVGAPYSSAIADLLDGTDSSGSIGLVAQQTFTYSGDVTATAVQTDMPSVSSAGSPIDLPVQLQFGLFTGPSLIPSPVPAIQIGSIQMPLHIHPPVGPPGSHMHQTQSPMFQFGQLRYTSPISHGILPVAPKSMSFVQPNILGHFNVNQNAGGSVTQEPARDSSTQYAAKDEVPSFSINKQQSLVSAPPEQTNGSLSVGLNTSFDSDTNKDKSVGRLTSSEASGSKEENTVSESGPKTEGKGKGHAVSKSYLPPSNERGTESRLQHLQPSAEAVADVKIFSGQRVLSPFPGGRGKRYAYAVKNSNNKSSLQAHDTPTVSNFFQRIPRQTIRRTEFRVRENNDRRPVPELISSSNTGSGDKSNYMGKAVGVSTRRGYKRGTISNRPMKQRNESEPSASKNATAQDANSGGNTVKEMAQKLSVKSQDIPHAGEANWGRNVSEDDVEAPLQSGVVRVFKQPGIEAPSDEDDFIEVRSKRKMLNDRREQREKEIKAKAQTTKPIHKPRATRLKDVGSRSHSKHYVPVGSEEPSNFHLDITGSESPHLVDNKVSTGFAPPAVAQPPVGTPAVNSEVQAIVKPGQADTSSAVSTGGTECNPGLLFDSKDKVMSLSQTQIDDAMKPARFDSHISAVGGHSCTVSDPILPTSSILTKDKTFSSGASPINSLLAGEKIQFGAVTSPTVIPPSSRGVHHGIGPPGSNRPDVQKSRNFAVSEKESSLFFEKDKHLSDSCVAFEDCEAEAEAAASAVAVAAISSDEIVGNGLGLVNNNKDFSASDIDGITTDVVVDRHSASQSRSEELSVSLPADLSVETTPISLWPPLPSPQSSSSQMPSHFPGGRPSHFPFYEMNPLLGGPIFAFSQHEESSGTQSQPPKSAASSSGPLGNWQQCHSGVDSFYGPPPAGYPGPFISPPGGLPGVQAPPHMVVYNHFAPVGQYGQVGLSFVGTTYIPSGKQGDRNNAPASAAMHIGEGDINNMNMTNMQRNAPNITGPIQHLAPGSPLMPMPSPLPMFDVSPFQSAPDLPVQARWSHIPASPLHSIPVSRPFQSQVEGALPSQVNHGHPIEQSLTANRFTDSRIPTPSDNAPSFTAGGDTNITAFPVELGLADSLRSTTTTSAGQSVVVQSSSGSSNTESSKTDTIENGLGDGAQHQSANSVKNQLSYKNTSAQQGNTAGYNYRASQRNTTGNEWSHRRLGFHGRKQPSGVDKGFPASKIKQIYVAKQSTSRNSTA